MDQKYQVPALQKADQILRAVSAEPYRLRLIDLSKNLGIHKSSMFSLLHAMERLGWLVKDKADTYAIGAFFGALGSSFLKRFSLIDFFHGEAAVSKERIGETLQLALLEKTEVLYLAKEEAGGRVRVVSEPGMRFPAHATALGKVQLAFLPQAEWKELYPTPDLERLTPYTITTAQRLFGELEQIGKDGFALDRQESNVGCCCAAAPVMDAEGKVVAGVSCSMTTHQWETKRQEVVAEVIRLGKRLSLTN